MDIPLPIQIYKAFVLGIEGFIFLFYRRNSMKKQNKVLIFGTFDIIHPGHLFFIREAERLGDLLYIVVGRDANVLAIKGRPPVHNEVERIRKLKEIAKAKNVFLGESHDKFAIIGKIKPDVICLGYDQDMDEGKLRKELMMLGLNPIIVRLSPYKSSKYKSSKFRDKQ
jgi:FAD synthetase